MNSAQPVPFFTLQDKVAVITGASSGIGLATAERFLAAGARVFGIDRSPQGAEPFPVLRADVSREAELASAFERVTSEAGSLDILLNNAAIQPLGVPLENLDGQLLQRTLEVNVAAVALAHKLALRHMRPGGRILNTGSFVGLVGTPGCAIYAASKAAVIHLTRLAALEFAPRGITVNCVCPGTIRTPAIASIPDNPEIPFVEQRTPLGRLGEPSEIAAAFHFLASPEASYITGAILPVDGGIAAGWERYDLVPPPHVVAGRWIDAP